MNYFKMWWRFAKGITPTEFAEILRTENDYARAARFHYYSVEEINGLEGLEAGLIQIMDRKDFLRLYIPYLKEYRNITDEASKEFRVNTETAEWLLEAVKRGETVFQRAASFFSLMFNSGAREKLELALLETGGTLLSLYAGQWVFQQPAWNWAKGRLDEILERNGREVLVGIAAGRMNEIVAGKVSKNVLAALLLSGREFYEALWRSGTVRNLTFCMRVYWEAPDKTRSSWEALAAREEEFLVPFLHDGRLPLEFVAKLGEGFISRHLPLLFHLLQSGLYGGDESWSEILPVMLGSLRSLQYLPRPKRTAPALMEAVYPCDISAALGDKGFRDLLLWHWAPGMPKWWQAYFLAEISDTELAAIANDKRRLPPDFEYALAMRGDAEKARAYFRRFGINDALWREIALQARPKERLDFVLSHGKKP